MDKNAKIFVAGHRGLVGSALVRQLRKQGYKNIIKKTRQQLDLLDEKKVNKFFEKYKPDYVFLAAAKVGGIMANKTQKAEFIYENLKVQMNVIHAAYKNGVKKLLFLGSSCIYPKLAKQPINESEFMNGYLEETNDAYAAAKIAGIYMCKSYNEQYGTNYISVMPTNLYGINDNFNLQSSHVFPALIRRFYEAKRDNKPEIVLWGSGSPMREFLFVDDLADACIHLMNTFDGSEIVNIGTGEDVTIKDLAELMAKEIGYTGKIVWDTSKPDGTPRKLMDVSKLAGLGWKYKTPLRKGLRKTIDWFIKHYDEVATNN
jgi:GDP-L-fucose synthase